MTDREKQAVQEVAEVLRKKAIQLALLGIIERNGEGISASERMDMYNVIRESGICLYELLEGAFPASPHIRSEVNHSLEVRQ